MADGISSRRIMDTPIAVLDFETTGLSPGTDRVVEVSVFRIEPDGKLRLAFDTMVNPRRSMAATEIHGITDQDVADAPEFEAIAGELAKVLSGCVVAAYNVYFDMKFLDYEFRRAGILQSPPHFCLMYLRPMLGLGARCRLGAACIDHGISYNESHIAADDAQASAQLMQEVYLREINDRRIETFGDLGKLKDYKFVRSFGREPLQAETTTPKTEAARLRSRVVSGSALTSAPAAPPSEAAPIAN